MMDEIGYVYAVCGATSFLREAVTSAISLKRADDNAHVTLITTPSLADQGQAEPAFDDVVVVDNETVDGCDVDWQTGLSFKAATIYEYSPYEHTLYLDSDTYVIDDCRGLFELLNYFDFCLSKVPGGGNSFTKNGREVTGYNGYNSGVILFRKSPQNKKLHRDWREKFETGDFWGDQQALTHALLESEVTPYVLPNNWNARFGKFENFGGRVHLLHGRHTNLEYIANRINVTSSNRVWIPPIKSCIYRGMDAQEIIHLIANVGKGVKRKVYGYLGWRDDPQYQTANSRNTTLFHHEK